MNKMAESRKSDGVQKMASSKINLTSYKGRKRDTEKPDPKFSVRHLKTKEDDDGDLTDRTERVRKIDLGTIKTSRSNHKIRHCEQLLQSNSQSILFYMKELQRRQEDHSRKREELQNDHVQKVFYLQRLLKVQINKNIGLEDDLRVIRQKQKTPGHQDHLKKSLQQLNDREIIQLFSELKIQLQHRYEKDLDISRIKEKKSFVHNQLVLSYSKTDQSLLLGDVTRHF